MRDQNSFNNVIADADQKKGEKEYWLNKLAGDLQRSHFPYDYKRTSENARKIEEIKFRLTSDLFLRVMKLVNKSDLRLHIILVTAVALLLDKYTYKSSGTNDIFVGAPICRQDITGNFINTVLILKNRLDENFSFKELLLQVSQTIAEANENVNYPIETLLFNLNIEFSPEDDFPLFDTAVLLENIHDKSDLQHIHLNMIFSFKREDEALTGVIEYNSFLYDKTTLERIIAHFDRLLQTAVFNVDSKITDLEILSDQEKKQLIEDFNNTITDYPRDKSIGRLFEEQAEKTPDNIAVVGSWGEADEYTSSANNRQISYKELNKKTNCLARLLLKKGVIPNTIVGLLVERSIEMIVGILGILKAGGAYLPIDSENPLNRILWLLNDCKAHLLLTEKKLMNTHTVPELQELHSQKIKLHVTPERQQILDLDNLPMPKRSLIDYEKYNQFLGQAMVKDSITLMGTRGCPYNCAYCHKIWPKKHAIRSAENIFSELKLYYDMGIRRFSFVDDIFNLDTDNSIKFFNLIIENKLDVQLFFPNGMRADILTKDYIDLMIKAGTVSVAFALETASPRLQKLIGKNLNLAKFRENIDYITEKYPQVILELFTMHGFPSETQEEAMMTLEFIKSVKWLHFPYVSILRIFTNTDMEKLALENGITKDAISRSENLAFHDLPETLVFDKSFTLKYQAEFLNEYFLSKERLLHVLPYQMNVLTEDEIAEKYNSYLPMKITSLDQFIDFVGITREELGMGNCGKEKRYFVPQLNEKLKLAFPGEVPSDDALKILLLDLSQFFDQERKMLYDVVEVPLGLMYILSYLNRQFGSKINGKIKKSRIDFDNYEALNELIAQFQPDVIGIRSLTLHKDFFHQTVSKIRQWGVNVPIIAGGPYATSNYEEILQDKNIDLAVIGEGEITFSEIIELIIENGGKLPDEDRLRKIQGIAFKTQEKDQAIKAAREILTIDELNNDELKDVSMEKFSMPPGRISDSSDLAYIIYTSGSSGKPKGVLTTHYNVTRVVRNTNYIDVAVKDRLLQLSNYAFDGSKFDIYGALLNGATLVLMPAEKFVEADRLAEVIKKECITVFFLTTALFNTLVDLRIDFFDHIRKVLFGGERVSVSHARKALDYAGENKIIHMYGPTETTVYATYYDIREIQDGAITIPIGKPLANTQAYILDKDLKTLPIGVYGDIYIGGDGVARGYLNRPGLTIEKFIENYPTGVTTNNTILYKTGDVGRFLPSGDIEFLGRADNQVKIRGFRIEPGEIESQLLAYEKVKEAVVLIKEDEKGTKSLCAYVVPYADKQATVSEFRDYLQKKLPDYMIPPYFVTLEALPLTPNGKIDHKALPDPKDASIKNKAQYVAPRNEIEEKLVKIWGEILGRKNIGINDDFFMIGGDSIVIIQIISRLKQEGYKIEMRDIFRYSRISELAPFIVPVKRTAPQTVVEGIIPLTPIQHFFFEIFDVDIHYFNQSVLLKTGEGFDEEMVKAVFTKLHEQHDALRMTFTKTSDGIIQTNHGLNYPFFLEIFDFRNQVTTNELLNAKIIAIQESINLENGPLMKLALFHFDDCDWLLIVCHHLVIDTVSWRILFEDIETLFKQYREEKIFELPLKSDSFSSWAEKICEYANSSKFLKEIPYWANVESTEIELIPKDFDYKYHEMKDSVDFSFTLCEKDTELLLTGINEVFNTEINDLLLAALGLSIQQTFGIKNIAVTLEGHGREEILEDIDINRTVGWFTSAYPVILNISNENDLGRLIKEVKESLRRIPNKGIGYGILKYLTATEHKKEIDFKLHSQIGFNYLGQFDTNVKGVSFQFVEDIIKSGQSQNSKSIYELNFGGLLTSNQLIIYLAYSNRQYKSETIETLMKNYKRSLEQIISFCNAKMDKELTPSDLTYKGLSIEQIENISNLFQD